ncbi:MAG: TetR family transcriptional regulator [Ruminococcus sp.]|nr:TetR family transcriptional regulator [Ruminococcus sp.]MCM1480474.1 TetR family transcriptional regulator [Muribaculaceae bacterium]
MANFTEKAIKASFIKLLEQHPLSRISVRDIVEDCGVNRNTFYYHFQDIPALLEEIITEDAERIIAEHPSFSSIEDCLAAAVEFCLGRKKMVLHIYDSLGRDVYNRNLLKICDHVISAYIDRLPGSGEIGKTDREIIVGLYRCECFGIITEWIIHGMSDDVVGAFSRVCELRRGFAEEMLKRAKKSD